MSDFKVDLRLSELSEMTEERLLSDLGEQLQEVAFSSWTEDQPGAPAEFTLLADKAVAEGSEEHAAILEKIHETGISPAFGGAQVRIGRKFIEHSIVRVRDAVCGEFYSQKSGLTADFRDVVSLAAAILPLVASSLSMVTVTPEQMTIAQTTAILVARRGLHALCEGTPAEHAEPPP